MRTTLSYLSIDELFRVLEAGSKSELTDEHRIFRQWFVSPLSLSLTLSPTTLAYIDSSLHALSMSSRRSIAQRTPIYIETLHSVSASFYYFHFLSCLLTFFFTPFVSSFFFSFCCFLPLTTVFNRVHRVLRPIFNPLWSIEGEYFCIFKEGNIANLQIRRF